MRPHALLNDWPNATSPRVRGEYAMNIASRALGGIEEWRWHARYPPLPGHGAQPGILARAVLPFFWNSLLPSPRVGSKARRHWFAAHGFGLQTHNMSQQFGGQQNGDRHQSCGFATSMCSSVAVLITSVERLNPSGLNQILHDR